MALSLIDLVRSEFRTTKAADELNGRFQTLLGQPHRYGPARLAIGRSLGLASTPPFEVTHMGYGKPIKGEHLFGQGAELATWITMLVAHADRPNLMRKDLQAEVAAHWHRGLYLLWDDWRASASDFDSFVGRLVQNAHTKGRVRA